MSYLVQQDIQDELGGVDKLIQLTDEDGSGTVGVARVQNAIDFASGTFDSYARTRYQIPVPTTPMVRTLCLDLACWQLVKSRTSIDEGRYKVRKDAYELAMKRLADIQSGKAALDVPTIQETATNPAAADETLRGSSASPPVFSDDKLSSY